MSSRLHIHACAILAFASVTTACDLAVDPAPGMIEIIAVVLEETITLPDTVAAGAPFEVAFAAGGDNCYQFGGTRVKQTGSRVELEPRAFVLNLELGEFVGGCELGTGFLHQVTLRLPQPGTATIAIRSLREWRRASPLDTLTFERTIVVR